jgi:hypothetical protein
MAQNSNEILSDIMIAFQSGDPSGDFVPQPGDPGFRPDSPTPAQIHEKLQSIPLNPDPTQPPPAQE